MTTTPIATLPIITSRSQYVTSCECLRKRWWQYEALNSGGTRGWERRKLVLPLVTGTHVHKGVEALLNGSTVEEAAAWARKGYMADVTTRGLEAEVESEGERVALEQAALIEALVYAWARVRMPRIAEEYDIVAVERELRVELAPDVVMQARADAVLRRKSDRRLFIFNPKTVGDAGERWLRSWETDLQVMTEILAVERTLGEPVAGVLIEGFIKGKRMPEKGAEDRVTGYRQSSPLIYGYKFDGNPPLEPPAYDHAYTRRKGWHRFNAWEDEGLSQLALRNGGLANGLLYWIHWLPAEVVEAQFACVPPVYWDTAMGERAVRQIVAQERRMREWREKVEAGELTLDDTFVQNTHSCIFPSKCQMYAMCWEAQVSDDPAGSGLFIPRIDHHASGEEA